MHFPAHSTICIACRFRREVCLCDEALRVETDLRLLIVIHELESRKMSNTGHLAKLVVADCRVATQPAWGRGKVDLSELAVTHGKDGRPWKTVLFFPGLGAELLTAEAVQRLKAPVAGGLKPRLRVIIPDGTWKQARRMVKRLSALAALPRVSLPAVESVVDADRVAMRPRGNPDPARVSTCEAIAVAMGYLGETEAETNLFKVYDEAALRIALMRGRMPLDGYRRILVPSQPPDVRR